MGEPLSREDALQIVRLISDQIRVARIILEPPSENYAWRMETRWLLEEQAARASEMRDKLSQPQNPGSPQE